MPSSTKEPQDSTLPKAIGKPALRALAQAGITRLDQLTRFTEAELLAMHGVGPKAVGVIQTALGEHAFQRHRRR